MLIDALLEPTNFDHEFQHSLFDLAHVRHKRPKDCGVLGVGGLLGLADFVEFGAHLIEVALHIGADFSEQGEG